MSGREKGGGAILRLALFIDILIIKDRVSVILLVLLPNFNPVDGFKSRIKIPRLVKCQAEQGTEKTTRR